MINFVVPSLKKGGVYDFACRLQEVFGEPNGRLVHLFRGNLADWIIEPDDSVVLQLSGYGFDKRGAPLWLLKEIEGRRRHIKSFGVFFHELYAFGPPWSSSFWLSPVQRHIARRLAEMSDFWMTSRYGSAQWLERFAGDKPHAVLPVFSTIGEPDDLAQARLPRVIVFGSPGLRQLTYQAAGDKLFTWAKQAALEIHDIGAPVADQQLLATLRSNGVALHGHLLDREIRHAMASAMLGLLAYPVEYAAKSSVFAAYAAHGLCPVLISKNYVPADGLVVNDHYLPGVPDNSVIFDAASVGQRAWEWYQPHNILSHVDAIAQFSKHTRVVFND